MKNEFDEDFVAELCTFVNSTDFGVLKTDALDFDSDFVWFDDNLFETERQVLEANSALDKFFSMDPRDLEMANKALKFLKSF